MGIEVKSLSKRYGTFQAIKDVSFEVSAGQLVALLGPSGSGKSTILRIIAGLEMADTGGVVLTGEDATRLPVQGRGVGFVFQHYALFRHMTVRDNIAFGLKVRKLPRAGQGPRRRIAGTRATCRLCRPLSVSTFGRAAAAGCPARRCPAPEGITSGRAFRGPRRQGP